MKNILIASSSSSFIERNATLLRRSDFQIFSANNITEITNLCKSNTIDLILVDHQLADIPGEECSIAVRALGLHQKPAVVLVCQDNAEEFKRLKGCGAEALIGRPVKPLQLIKTVGQFLTVQLVRSRRVSLRVKVISHRDGVEFYCLSHNVSLTGMLIETEYFLEEGSHISCQFYLPDAAIIECEGEVVRSARTIDGAHQYGIHFTSISRAYRQLLDLYIASVVRGDAGIR